MPNPPADGTLPATMPPLSAESTPSPSSSPSASVHRPQVLVSCLCAGWCTTCDAYRPVFEALAVAHPGVVFTWVDVEDHSDAMEDAPGGAPDIQNFPTLLLARDGAPLFFGTVLPHAAVLERLLADAATGRHAARVDAQAAGVVQAVQGLLRTGEVARLGAGTR